MRDQQRNALWLGKKEKQQGSYKWMMEQLYYLAVVPVLHLNMMSLKNQGSLKTGCSVVKEHLLCARCFTYMESCHVLIEHFMYFLEKCLFRYPAHLIFFQQALFFTALLGSQQNGQEGAEISYIPPVPIYSQSSPLSKSHTRLVYLLQLMNLNLYTLITQNPQFILRFTLGVVHSESFGKYMIGIQYC